MDKELIKAEIKNMREVLDELVASGDLDATKAEEMKKEMSTVIVRKEIVDTYGGM